MRPLPARPGDVGLWIFKRVWPNAVYIRTNDRACSSPPAIDRYLVLLLWAPLPQYSTRVDNPCGPLWGGWDVSTVAVWSPEAISLVKAVPNAGKEWAYDV